MINGIHGVTGMQYANTSRGGAETNNAKFQQGTAVVRVNMAGGGSQRAAGAPAVRMDSCSLGRNRQQSDRGVRVRGEGREPRDGRGRGHVYYRDSLGAA